MADDANWPIRAPVAESDDLAPGEQVMLSALRHWARLRLSGEAPQAPVRAMISAQVSDRAGAIFVAMMESLERQTVRPLEIRCPGCAGYALDEQRIVVACGVSRVDMGLTRALLRPLVMQPEPVAIFARAFNMVLRHEGVDMPPRLGDIVPQGQASQGQASQGQAPRRRAVSGATLH